MGVEEMERASAAPNLNPSEDAPRNRRLASISIDRLYSVYSIMPSTVVTWIKSRPRLSNSLVFHLLLSSIVS